MADVTPPRPDVTPPPPGSGGTDATVAGDLGTARGALERPVRPGPRAPGAARHDVAPVPPGLEGTPRIAVRSFSPGASPTLVDRFVAVGQRIQLADPRRTPTAAADVAARLQRGADRALGLHLRAFVATVEGRDVGRCTAALPDDLRDEHGRRVGFVGHWECEDDDVVSGVLLDQAIEHLSGEGVEVVVGPIDLTTWHGYRFSTSGDPSRPAHLLEPVTPDRYVAQWRAHGFEVDEEYATYEIDEPTRDLAIEAVRPMVQAELARGTRLRQLRMREWDAMVEELHATCAREFSANPHFTPLSLEAFRRMYEPARRIVDPRMVFHARDADEDLVGFVFSLPDLGAAAHAVGRRGRRGIPAALRARAACDTSLVKSLAVRREDRGSFAVLALMSAAYRSSRDLGYRRIMHMLMHEDARSTPLTERFPAREVRRYATFRLELSAPRADSHGR